MKCLIADHSMVTRRAIANALRPLLDQEVVEAATVEDAFLACDETVDVIVVGWNEGDFDGLGLARRLRGRGTDGTPRIVIVSPHNERAKVLDAVAAGINAYVLRPFDPEVLLRRVEALFAVSGGESSGEGTEKLAA